MDHFRLYIAILLIFLIPAKASPAPITAVDSLSLVPYQHPPTHVTAERVPNIKSVITLEDLEHSPARNAAEALQGTPGVSLNRHHGQGQYVQVRGLGAQLNSVTVNGHRIPTPTLDPSAGRGVGLDLLQFDQVGSIEVVKALTPDMDADALGGAINFNLRRPGAEPAFSLSAGGWHDAAADLGSSAKVSLQASDRLLSKGRLGLVFGGSFYRSQRAPSRSRTEYATVISDTVESRLFDAYDVERQRYGLLAGADYRLSRNIGLRFNYTYNAFLDDEIRRRREYLPTESNEEQEVRNRLEDQRYTLVETGMEWRRNRWAVDAVVSHSRSSEDLPDRTYYRHSRINTYVAADGEPLSQVALGALERSATFPELAPFVLDRVRFDLEDAKERDFTGQLDVTYALVPSPLPTSIKAGIKVWNKEKRARDRRWQQTPTGDAALATSEGEFPLAGVHYDEREALALFPLAGYRSRPQLINYRARERIYAAYLMATRPWTERLVVMAGVRGERTQHAYRHDAGFEESDEAYYNLLPSLHLSYRADAYTHWRLALTSGLARPEYIRLLPIITPPSDGVILQGNPDLVSTKSFGLDLLYEKFAEASGFISVGLYAKLIRDPVIDSAERRGPFTILRPINGDGGYLAGVEVAAERTLTSLLDLPVLHWVFRYPGRWPVLRYSALGVSYAYSHTRIDYGGGRLADASGVVRGDVGPLPGHARHLARVALSYRAPVSGVRAALSYDYRSPMFKSLANDVRGDIWYGDESQWNFSLNWPLNDHLAAQLNLNNLSDEGESEIYGDPYGANRPREREQSGRAGLLEIRYSY